MGARARRLLLLQLAAATAQNAACLSAAQSADYHNAANSGIAACAAAVGVDRPVII